MLLLGLWQIKVALVKAANRQNTQMQPGFICELGCGFLITSLLLRELLRETSPVSSCLAAPLNYVLPCEAPGD